MLTGDFGRRTFVSPGDPGSILLAEVNEGGDREELAKIASSIKVDSLSFDIHETDQYVSFASSLTSRETKLKGAMRWILLMLSGFGAGGVAVLIQFVLKWINQTKFDVQESLWQAEASLLVRYLVWAGMSLVLVSIAAALVCYVEPLAGGSGIPEIKCVLNGIDLPNVLHLRTLIAKSVGICCSVAAGLPCGKEGPMIHSGAIVAAQATHANAGSLKKPYKLNTESRDLIVAGAAAGVAAAFGAPIGGVLFAVEEGATHMSPLILVRTFVCAAVSALTVRFFAGPMDHATPWGTLGTEVPVEFGRFESRVYQVWELGIFALMGCIGGLAGALFNAINTRLSKWRMRVIGPRGHLRFVEALLLTLAIVSFNFFAPLFRGGSSQMSKFDGSQKLFVDIGGHAINVLFHTRADEPLDNWTLFFFAVIHYFQTILTYGLGVPSGLFVPSLLGGASFGRLFGQNLHHFLEPLKITATDVGVYALIGATAMLSGMARITISLAAILMETTGEAQWGIPIFLVVMCAKWTGDLFNKGIYDIHIELRHIPLLEQKPNKHMLFFKARNIMAVTLTIVQSTPTVGELLEVLENTKHSAYPVVNARGCFLGMLDRTTLLHVLELGQVHGAFFAPGVEMPDPPVIVPWRDMVTNRHPERPPLSRIRPRFTDEDLLKRLDVLPYTNLGTYTVSENAAAVRCHLLFRNMGMRHLPVVNHERKILGMITRKDLIAASEHLHHSVLPGQYARSRVYM